MDAGFEYLHLETDWSKGITRFQYKDLYCLFLIQKITKLWQGSASLQPRCYHTFAVSGSRLYLMCGRKSTEALSETIDEFNFVMGSKSFEKLFDIVPDECILLILSFLDEQSLGTCMCVSRRLKHIACKTISV